MKKSKALTASITRLHSANMIDAWREDRPASCCPIRTMPSSKAASTNSSAPLNHNKAAGRPGALAGGLSRGAPPGARGVGRVLASPSIVTPPSSADVNSTACADRAGDSAALPSNDQTPSATATSPGPNRKPSRDMALSQAKRRAR